jgi:hypothetical protein
MAARDIGHPRVTEKQFQQSIIDTCGFYGLYCYHTRDSRGSVAGFPDLVIVGHTGVLFRELKLLTGVVSPIQRSVLRRLSMAGADADVWRPADWASGRIAIELAAIRRPRL